MSFTELLAEIPQLDVDQLREISRVVEEARASKPESEWRVGYVDGRLRMLAPRVILQSEVEAILQDFP